MEKKHRGGSDTARRLEQTGIVIHVSKEERVTIGVAAAKVGKNVKAFAKDAVLEKAKDSSGLP